MSVPYPYSPRPLSDRTEPLPGSGDSVPIKPFRPVPALVQQGNTLMTRFRTLYEDKREWNRAIIIAVLMVIAIAGSVIGKTTATYGILALFVGAILLTAASDAWAGLLLFIVYTSMEGMFKYTTLFSNTVYAVGPVMAVYIFVVWRIASRSKEAMSAAKDDPKIKQAIISQKAEKGAAFPAVAPILFAFALLHVVQIFNPESAGLFSATAGTLIWYLAPLMLFFVAYFTVQNSKQLGALMYVLIAIGFVTSAYAMVQYFLGDVWCYTHIVGLESVNRISWYNLGKSGVETGVFRPVSTFSLPGGYVWFSEFGIIASILVAQMDKMPPVRRGLVLALASVMAIALLVAGIRIVLINTVVVVMLMLSLSVRSLTDAVRIYFVSFLILLAGTTAFLITNTLTEGKIGRRIGKAFTDPISSFKKNRGYHFQTLLEAIAIRPFGLGVQRAATNWRSARQFRLRDELAPLANRETQWNAIQSDAGLLGVVLLGTVFVVFTRDSWLILKKVKHPRLRMVVIYLGVVIVSNMISCFGAPIMQGNFLFWIAAGVLYAVPRIHARENQYLLSGETNALESVTAVTGNAAKAAV